MTYTNILRGALLILCLSVAPAALAYLSPEDVLLNKELYLPPTKRESDDRVEQQSRESAERREREQEILFKAQYSSEALSAPAVSMPQGNGAAPELGSLNAEDLRLLQTIRLLDRVQRNQQVVLYSERMLPLQADALHGGAPLSPTGAGGILSGLTMLGAVGWTIWRAKKGKVMIAK